MNTKEIDEQLNFCLLTNDEMVLGPQKWRTEIPDPFEDFENDVDDFDDDDNNGNNDDDDDDDDDD